MRSNVRGKFKWVPNGNVKLNITDESSPGTGELRLVNIYKAIATTIPRPYSRLADHAGPDLVRGKG